MESDKTDSSYYVEYREKLNKEMNYFNKKLEKTDGETETNSVSSTSTVIPGRDRKTTQDALTAQHKASQQNRLNRLAGQN